VYYVRFVNVLTNESRSVSGLHSSSWKLALRIDLRLCWDTTYQRIENNSRQWNFLYMTPSELKSRQRNICKALHAMRPKLQLDTRTCLCVAWGWRGCRARDNSRHSLWTTTTTSGDADWTTTKMAAKKTTKRSAAAAVVAVTAVASTSHLASFSAFYLDTKQPFYALAAAPLCFRVVRLSVRAAPGQRQSPTGLPSTSGY